MVRASLESSFEYSSSNLVYGTGLMVNRIFTVWFRCIYLVVEYLILDQSPLRVVVLFACSMLSGSVRLLIRLYL
jgi:hypothetical protein